VKPCLPDTRAKVPEKIIGLTRNPLLQFQISGQPESNVTPIAHRGKNIGIGKKPRQGIRRQNGHAQGVICQSCGHHQPLQTRCQPGVCSGSDDYAARGRGGLPLLLEETPRRALSQMVQIMDQRRYHQQIAIAAVQTFRNGKNSCRHHDMRKMTSVVISVTGPLPCRESDEPGDRPIWQSAF